MPPKHPTSNFMSIFILALSTQLVPPIYTWAWGCPVEHDQHTEDQTYKEYRTLILGPLGANIVSSSSARSIKLFDMSSVSVRSNAL